MLTALLTWLAVVLFSIAVPTVMAIMIAEESGRFALPRPVAAVAWTATAALLVVIVLRFALMAG